MGERSPRFLTNRDVTLGADRVSIDLVVYLKLISACLIFGPRQTNECRFGLQTGLDAQRPDQTSAFLEEHKNVLLINVSEY